jgi:hypothetical protein
MAEFRELRRAFIVDRAERPFSELQPHELPTAFNPGDGP